MRCPVLPWEPLTCTCAPHSSPHPHPPPSSLAQGVSMCLWVLLLLTVYPSRTCAALEEKARLETSYPRVHDSTLVSVPPIPRTRGTRQRILSGRDLRTFAERVSWGGVAGEVRGARWHSFVRQCLSAHCVVASVLSTLDTQPTRETEIPAFSREGRDNKYKCSELINYMVYQKVVITRQKVTEQRWVGLPGPTELLMLCKVVFPALPPPPPRSAC